MTRRIKRTSTVVWLRRAVQTACLLLFVYLFLETTYHPINQVEAPVELFFDLDPLVLLSTWHIVTRAVLLSAIVVIVTILFGRWFCGWICPFGVLHNAVTALRNEKVKSKLVTGGGSAWQRVKYLVLVFFLAGLLGGVNLVGWLDPFSFFYRALAVAVFPAFNFVTQSVFGWIYEKDPGIGPVRVTAASEPVYGFLREKLLAVEQPHYMWATFIGLLFVAVVVVNIYRPRFWCRVLCPLGALLGLLGKNPVLRLHKDSALCNDCRMCVADCPGGANPDVADGWKPSECFFCWNCDSACPHEAISFRLRRPETKPLVELENDETPR